LNLFADQRNAKVLIRLFTDHFGKRGLFSSGRGVEKLASDRKQAPLCALQQDF
jgi:hypothetical protein